jgi:hypothetical protein
LEKEMTGKVQIKGKVIPGLTPTYDQMVVIAAEMKSSGLARLLTLTVEEVSRGTITAEVTVPSDVEDFDSIEFASKMAALIDHPDLGDLLFHGELVVIEEGDPLPSIQRFQVKAGSITRTKARLSWATTSTIIRPLTATTDN